MYCRIFSYRQRGLSNRLGLPSRVPWTQGLGVLATRVKVCVADRHPQESCVVTPSGANSRVTDFRTLKR